MLFTTTRCSTSRTDTWGSWTSPPPKITLWFSYEGKQEQQQSAQFPWWSRSMCEWQCCHYLLPWLNGNSCELQYNCFFSLSEAAGTQCSACPITQLKTLFFSALYVQLNDLGESHSVMLHFPCIYISCFVLLQRASNAENSTYDLYCLPKSSDSQNPDGKE